MITTLWKYRQFILIALVLLFAWTTYDQSLKLSNERSQKDEVIKALSKKTLEAKVYQNKYGATVTRIQALEFDRATLKAMVEKGFIPEIKGLEGVKKNVKNLESVLQTQTEMIDSLLAISSRKPVIVQGDTIDHLFALEYKDKFAEITVEELKEGQSILEYQISTGKQTVAIFWSRKWFLGRKSWSGEATCENPKARVDSLLVVVKKR